MQDWIIRKLGGYPTIEEALESAPQKTLDAAVSKLFCVVNKDEILREDKGALWYKGRTLSEDEVRSLREEAKMLYDLPLFKMINDELRYKASKKIYFESQTIEDVTWGKLMLFIADVITQRVDRLSK